MSSRNVAVVLALSAFILSLGCAIASPSSLAASKHSGTVKVFILAGQSNMAGRGDATELPSYLKSPQKHVRYYYQCSFGADKGSPFSTGGTYSSERWIPLQPGRKHPSTPGEHFGPEISFGRTIADRWRGREIALIKMGRGGTSLAEDWNPSATAGKQLYRELRGLIREATQSLVRHGETLEIVGMVWMQGEADTLSSSKAKAYEANLKTFVTRIRADLERPHLPFLIGQIVTAAKSPKLRYAHIVREAQARVAQQDTCAALVTTDGLEDMGDGIHFDSKSQIKLGERFARSFLPLAERCH